MNDYESLSTQMCWHMCYSDKYYSNLIEATYNTFCIAEVPSYYLVDRMCDTTKHEKALRDFSYV